MFDSCSYPDKEWWVSRSVCARLTLESHRGLPLHAACHASSPSWNDGGFYCFFSPPGTRASWLKTPWRWVDTSRWWRPSPPTRECFETSPLRPNVSRTTSRAGESGPSHGGLERGLRPNRPCLRFSAIPGWCPPWRCLLLTPTSRWLSSTSTGLHGSLHLTDEGPEKSHNVLQIIYS